MFFTVSHGSFRWVSVKVLVVTSASSSADSGMPDNIRLSHVLWAWKLIIFFFLNAVRDLTVSCSIAFSKDPLKKWNSRCRISTRDNLGWMLDNRLLI